MLHKEKELFEQIVLRTAEEIGIPAEIIEKDYYVTLFLKAIVKEQPNIIFKGGTSLSKCYKLIDRFSEDIDLNIETENKPTESQRKRLKASILAVVDSFGFIVRNLHEVGSRKAYNKYIVDYPSVFEAQYLKKSLIIETSVYIRAYPTRDMNVTSMIYEYLSNNGFNELIDHYDLTPFKIKVQTAERTLIDKLFALGDYYLADKTVEHSRHIYDLYKLLEVVSLNDDLKPLVLAVRMERSLHAACLSAQEGVNINTLLKEIVDKNVYEDDYKSITEKLLFETVSYEEAIKALQKIIDSRILE